MTRLQSALAQKTHKFCLRNKKKYLGLMLALENTELLIIFICILFFQLTMNDFSVHRIIGRGGFGEVYGCRKADTGTM